MVSDSTKLQEILDYSFANIELLNCSLRHASTTVQRTDSNERLEFLGDRVLGLVIAEILYNRFPGEEEGPLARRFAGLTSREGLAQVADCLNLLDFTRTQVVDVETEKRSHSSIAADTLEAVLGAMYLDGGLKPPKSFITQHWERLIEQDLVAPKDAKTTLQEWAQSHTLKLPSYEIVSRDGPDHAPVFTMCVTVEGQEPQFANGTSRRTAEQAAAHKLLSIVEKI